MKQCSSCAKPAIFHVTLLQQNDVKELHFCEHHFGEYMNHANKPGKITSLEDELAALAGAQQEDAPTAESLTEDVEEELICPQCGISYQEFRKQGRFGCAHDYVVFHQKLYKRVPIHR
jgi:protein arginine kinase activator